MEHVTVTIDRDDPSPVELKGYMAVLFASLDERPRPLLVKMDVRNDRRARVSIDLKDGEPVFCIEGQRPARADFRGRYIAEHKVPLVLPRFGTCRLVMEPVDDNRVKVRKATILDRLFA
ncbi:MAG: hypothetical protein IJI54_00125 [Kiritimatiellae bacterium]|nr:hypothetical protein [Kiritimatiellia bacterium]